MTRSFGPRLPKLWRRVGAVPIIDLRVGTLRCRGRAMHLAADQCNFVALVPGVATVISIGDNVTIQNCMGGAVGYTAPGVTIGGNFVCTDNPLTCVADNGVVYGNSTVDDNRLPFSNMTSPSEVLGNNINGNAEISCNAVISGNTAMVGGDTISGNPICFDHSPESGPVRRPLIRGCTQAGS